MPKQFREGCLSFSYPDNWMLERQDSDNGWTVTLQSPDTAFFLLTLDKECPECDHMADTVLNTMRAEYPQLESDDSAGQIAGQWAIGHDMSFIRFDLTNTCWTRCFDTPDGTALLMCQATDHELPHLEPVLRAICASLRIVKDE